MQSSDLYILHGAAGAYSEQYISRKFAVGIEIQSICALQIYSYRRSVRGNIGNLGCNIYGSTPIVIGIYFNRSRVIRYIYLFFAVKPLINLLGFKPCRRNFPYGLLTAVAGVISVFGVKEEAFNRKAFSLGCGKFENNSRNGKLILVVAD